MKFKHIYRSTNPIPCILNNVPYIGSNRYDVYDPSSPDHRVLHQVSSCNVEDAKKLVASSHNAFKDWHKSTLKDRKQIAFRASALLKDQLQESIQVVGKETCVTQGMAKTEQMLLACSHLDQLTKTKDAGLAPRHVSGGDGDEGIKRTIYKEPYGVVLGIAPWNVPFFLGLRAILYPIFSGNTAILKTSEYAPQVQNMVAATLFEAGLPSGVLNVAHVAPEDAATVTKSLISHPLVRKVNFTGSTRVGSTIATLAGKYLKPTCMELGGRGSMIVLADADLDLAAHHLVFGGFLNSNQICMAVQQIYAHESIASELATRVKQLFTQHQSIFTANYEFEGSHALRALFNKASGQRVFELYEDAISKGAKVLAGTPQFDGALVQPLVLSHVTPAMRLYHEETFGPILSLSTFKDVESAVKDCNQSDYALSSCVFGTDLTKAEQVARSLETAMVHVNTNSVSDDPSMLHGGWKSSGWGHLTGSWDEFTRTQCVDVQPGHIIPLEFM